MPDFVKCVFPPGKLDLFDEEDFEMEQEFERERHQDRNKAVIAADHREKEVLPPWQVEQKEKSEKVTEQMGNIGATKGQFNFNAEWDNQLAKDELSVNKPLSQTTEITIHDVTETEAVPEVFSYYVCSICFHHHYPIEE